MLLQPGSESRQVGGIRQWLLLAGDIEHEVQESGECDKAAGERIQEEFDSGPLAILAAPDGDQEEQRDQSHFEEDVKQHQVERTEDSDQTSLQEQQCCVELGGAIADGFP